MAMYRTVRLQSPGKIAAACFGVAFFKKLRRRPLGHGFTHTTRMQRAIIIQYAKSFFIKKEGYFIKM